MTALKEGRAQLIAIIFCLFAWCLPAGAFPLEGNDASGYSHYCPAEHRAVWVDTFDQENLAGYTQLICLNDATQDISDWWITPENAVIAYDELPELPEPEPTVFRPSYADFLYAPEHPINRDPVNRQALIVSFKIEYPDLPDLGFNYGSAGSSSTNGNGEVVSSVQYWVEGVEVDQATYAAYEQQARAAESAQRLERDRLVHQSAQAKLYELVNINNWHDWLNVEEVNTRSAGDACWIYKESLLISLNRSQIDSMVQSSVHLVRAEGYSVAVTDGGDDQVLVDGVQAIEPEWSVQSECLRYNQYEYEFYSGVSSAVESETGGVAFDETVDDVGIADAEKKGGKLGTEFVLLISGFLMLRRSLVLSGKSR